jgi:hypothetical protein
LSKRLLSLPQLPVKRSKRFWQIIGIEKAIIVDILLYVPNHGHVEVPETNFDVPSIQPQKRFQEDVSTRGKNRMHCRREDSGSTAWSLRWKNSVVRREHQI